MYCDHLLNLGYVGNHIACCNDNFLICGANCKEDHIAMIRYATNLLNEIENIESQVYTDIIDGINITFTFELLPGDMKWLAFYGGELVMLLISFHHLVMSMTIIRIH